jgi:hypothetical protein
MLPYRTKTNRAWAADAPLEIWRVSTNHKGDAVREKVKQDEIATLKEGLDDVLHSGKLPQNNKNRQNLFISLNRAAAAFSLKQPLAPKDLVEALARRIEEVSTLLAELKKYRSASKSSIKRIKLAMALSMSYRWKF